MGLSLFLAKLLGLYLLIVAGVWIARKEEVDKAIKEIFNSRGMLALTGWMSLIPGLAIAIGHPVWQLNWRGLITLLGYLMIVKGIMRIAFVEQVEKYTLKILSKHYWVIIAVLVVLGAILTYSGFSS